MKLEPIKADQRIVSLDVIRGVALLGILIVNMPAFTTPALQYELYGMSPEYTGVDYWVRLFFDLFVQAKFYPMFSFLFGVGFHIFLVRAERNTGRAKRFYVYRLFILLLLGLLHLTLLWYGDILHTYALAGLFLLFFYQRKPSIILIWAVGLITFFYVLMASSLFLPAAMLEQKDTWNQAAGMERVEESIHSYNYSNYLELAAYRLSKEVIPVLENAPYQIPQILGLFLFGLYIGNREILSTPLQHTRFIRLSWIISGVISIPFILFLGVLQLDWVNFGVYQNTVSLVVQTVGGPFLTAFYIGSLVLLLCKARWRKRLHVFGITGRMALTNYMGQTMITLTIVLGFGLYNKISITYGLVLSLIIYTLQAVFSVYWLKHFRFGPLEWVWRSLTYGELQKMKLSE